MENLENNQLIAEFMGYEVIKYKGQPTYNGNKNAKTIGELKELWQGLDLEFTGRYCKDVNYPFSSDWRYIMPVVTKIEQEGFDFTIGKMKCTIKNTWDIDEPKYHQEWISGSAKIHLVYHTVVEFIKWHNEKKVFSGRLEHSS